MVLTLPRHHVRRSARHIVQRPIRSYSSQSLFNPSTKDIYDIAIVGGGPVGLSLLTAVKSNPNTSGLKCALIESQPLDKQKTWSLPPTCYSNRASSITPTNQRFLEQIGAWRQMDLRRVQPYDEMQVWDGGNDSSMVFDWRAEAKRYNAPLRTVATMVENANLTKSLLLRLEELGAMDCVFAETSVQSIDTGIDDETGLDMSSWPVLTLKQASSTHRVAARLLVGADGINSPVRTFSGINTYGWDYDRHGVVATLELDRSDEKSVLPSSEVQSALDDFLSDESHRDHGQDDNISPPNRATAYQRFLPAIGGPIAILPLPDNHASLVWSTKPKIASYLKSLPPASLTACINAALRLSQIDIEYLVSTLPSDSHKHHDELIWRLTHTPSPSIPGPVPVVKAVQEGTLASFPLRLRQAQSYTHPRVALAGDAAHTIHPLAGQGLNLGLGDAECLARTIDRSVGLGADIGDVMYLETYGRERYTKCLAIAGGVDLLNSVFQSGDGGVFGSLVSRARGLGMSLAAGGWIPGLKEQIMRQAD